MFAATTPRCCLVLWNNISPSSRAWQTIFDQRTNTNEIVVASVLIHDAVQADGETFNPMAGYYHFSMVRKLKTTPFPHDLQVSGLRV